MRKVFVPCILALTMTSLIGPPGVWAEEFAWATRMGGTQYDDGIDIAVDGNGNSYVTGSFSGAADFGPYSLTSVDSNDAFVTKLDNAGSVQWAMRMGGSNISGGIGIAMDGMGNSYVIGMFTADADFGPYNLTSVGSEDIFVAKVDNTGSVQWATRMGSPGLDYGLNITVDGDGNSYVTGSFSGAADFGPYNLASAGSDDIFIAKLDNTGSVQWAMRMGGLTATPAMASQWTETERYI